MREAHLDGMWKKVLAAVVHSQKYLLNAASYEL
jgi:hypothetical protein